MNHHEWKWDFFKFFSSIHCNPSPLCRRPVYSRKRSESTVAPVANEMYHAFPFPVLYSATEKRCKYN